MKILILKDNLVAGLSVVERAIGASANLPVLKNVKIAAGDGGIFVTGTNLELAITHEVSGKVLESGEATCPFGILNSVVKNVSTERITLEKGAKKLVLTTDNYEAQLQSQDPKEFPLIPSIQDETKTVSIPKDALENALGNVIVATQYTDIRPEISGVLFRFHEEGFTCVATDSFRLAEQTVKFSAVPPAMHGVDAIVPLRTAEEVLRILSLSDQGDMAVTVETNQVLFHNAATRIISRLIDGRFPEYQGIIPKEVKNEVSIDREELIRAIKLTSSFTGRANDLSLNVSENKKSLELYSGDAALGENRYRLPVKAKGEKFSIVFNWRYLLDGLRMYRGAEVVLGVNTPDRPALIRDAKESNLVYVVMPVKP